LEERHTAVPHGGWNLSVTVSEAKLQSAFNRYVDDADFIMQRKRFHSHVREFEALQGRADFVVSPTNLKSLNYKIVRQIAHGIPSPSSALILSVLTRRKPVRPDDLTANLGLSLYTVRKSLSHLEASDIVEQCGNSEYRISQSFRMPSVELWALELKLHDWKRALYQTLQYRTFAHCAAVVVPEESACRIEKHAGRFSSFNIGVLAFDMDDWSLRTVVRLKTGEPSVDYHHIYAMAEFIRRSYQRKLR
jgi:DNA-binding transcriptional ArsR family regulator